MSTPDSGPSALRRLIAEGIGTHEVVAASLGLNATDLRCLELAWTEEDMTPTRLAELSDLTSGAVTGVLDRLERAGFVRRESDPNDRRRLLVRVDAG
jgi:DNA-binding MarR family transcriptional regulator